MLRRMLSLCWLLLPRVEGIHPECKIFQQVVKEEALCLEKNETISSDIKGCSRDWDGLTCWPRAAFGEVVKVPCPRFFEEITNIHGFLQRNCTQEAFWSEPFPPYTIACGFDEGSSKGPEDQKSYYSAFWHVYTAGYAASVTSLITALIIFAAFRKFHCTRNYIHMHLFVSFILRAIAVFTKDAVLFADETMDHCLMSTVACKAAVAFFQFSILANFFWLLIEGIYLQTLLLLTFVSDKQYVWWFIYTGWGAPSAVIVAWVFTRIHRQNTGCWDDDENGIVLWIIKGPIMLSILINFIIFINVIRILVHKLKSQEGGGSHSSHFVRLAKSTLLLIPLFGVHYIVFAFFPESTGLEARLYIELGLGSFQGFVVALLYCFSNAEVQSELKKQLCKWQYQEYLNFTHKQGTLSRENSPVNYVTQLSLLEKISPKRKTSVYQNAPGLTAVVGGRPKVSPVLKPFFFYYPKSNVQINLFLNGQHVETFEEDLTFTSEEVVSFDPPKISSELKDLPSGPHTYRLEDLAYTRSGDKGNSANIGVIARHPLYYPYLKKTLTAQALGNYFQHLLEQEKPEEELVTRYELPGIYGLNFVLKNSLGGGGIASLRSDPQGKALGQMLLDFQIQNVPDLKSLIE